MNNIELASKSSILSTMASGERADAWHWRHRDISHFSTEKLGSILSLSPRAQNEDDRLALELVRQELERRNALLRGGGVR